MLTMLGTQTTSSDQALQQRIDQLRPWRYNHQAGRRTIRADTDATRAFDQYGRELMRHIVKNILAGHDAADLRALDLGCLEGHYADLLCQAGFQEVVGVDLSEQHVRRAEFLLQEFQQHPNARIVRANACDERKITSLGKFNVILFHGLLYHLKDPLKVFDIIERLVPDQGPFVLLLSTQYKGTFSAVVNPEPLAELQIKPIEKRPDGLLFNPQDQSVFERCSLRLNPAAVYQVLKAYGYEGLIAYDSPTGYSYSFHNDLIVTKRRDLDLLHALNGNLQIPGCRFYEWDGRSVNSFGFRRRWGARLTRTCGKLAVRLGQALEKVYRR